MRTSRREQWVLRYLGFKPKLRQRRIPDASLRLIGVKLDGKSIEVYALYGLPNVRKQYFLYKWCSGSPEETERKLFKLASVRPAPDAILDTNLRTNYGFKNGIILPNSVIKAMQKSEPCIKPKVVPGGRKRARVDPVAVRLRSDEAAMEERLREKLQGYYGGPPRDESRKLEPQDYVLVQLQQIQKFAVAFAVRVLAAAAGLLISEERFADILKELSDPQIMYWSVRQNRTSSTSSWYNRFASDSPFGTISFAQGSQASASGRNRGSDYGKIRFAQHLQLSGASYMLYYSMRESNVGCIMAISRDTWKAASKTVEKVALKLLSARMKENREQIKREVAQRRAKKPHLKIPIFFATDGAWQYKAKMKSSRGVVLFMARSSIECEWKLVAIAFVKMINTAAKLEEVKIDVYQDLADVPEEDRAAALEHAMRARFPLEDGHARNAYERMGLGKYLTKFEMLANSYAGETMAHRLMAYYLVSFAMFVGADGLGCAHDGDCGSVNAIKAVCDIISFPFYRSLDVFHVFRVWLREVLSHDVVKQLQTSQPVPMAFSMLLRGAEQLDKEVLGQLAPIPDSVLLPVNECGKRVPVYFVSPWTNMPVTATVKVGQDGSTTAKQLLSALNFACPRAMMPSLKQLYDAGFFRVANQVRRYGEVSPPVSMDEHTHKYSSGDMQMLSSVTQHSGVTCFLASAMAWRQVCENAGSNYSNWEQVDAEARGATADLNILQINNVYRQLYANGTKVHAQAEDLLKRGSTDLHVNMAMRLMALVVQWFENGWELSGCEDIDADMGSRIAGSADVVLCSRTDPTNHAIVDFKHWMYCKTNRMHGSLFGGPLLGQGSKLASAQTYCATYGAIRAKKYPGKFRLTSVQVVPLHESQAVMVQKYRECLGLDVVAASVSQPVPAPTAASSSSSSSSAVARSHPQRIRKPSPRGYASMDSGDDQATGGHGGAGSLANEGGAQPGHGDADAERCRRESQLNEMLGCMLNVQTLPTPAVMCEFDKFDLDAPELPRGMCYYAPGRIESMMKRGKCEDVVVWKGSILDAAHAILQERERVLALIGECMRSVQFTYVEVDDVLNGRRSLLEVARSAVAAARAPRKEKRRQLFENCCSRSTPPKDRATTVEQPSMVAGLGTTLTERFGIETATMSPSVHKYSPYSSSSSSSAASSASGSAAGGQVGMVDHVDGDDSSNDSSAAAPSDVNLEPGVSTLGYSEIDIDSDEEWGLESGDLEDALQQASETPALVAKAISSLDSSKDYDISREAIAAPSMDTAQRLLKSICSMIGKKAGKKPTQDVAKREWEGRLHRGMSNARAVALAGVIRCNGQANMTDPQREAVVVLWRVVLTCAIEHWCGHHSLCSLVHDAKHGDRCQHATSIVYKPQYPSYAGPGLIASVEASLLRRSTKDVVAMADPNNSTTCEQLNKQSHRYSARTDNHQDCFYMFAVLGYLCYLYPRFREEALRSSELKLPTSPVSEAASRQIEQQKRRHAVYSVSSRARSLEYAREKSNNLVTSCLSRGDYGTLGRADEDSHATFSAAMVVLMEVLNRLK